jgi:hypothetical protein
MQSGGHACQGSGAAREPRLPCQRRPTRRRQARAPASPAPVVCMTLCMRKHRTAPTRRGRGCGGCKPAARGFPGHGAGRAAAAGGACAARQEAGAACAAGRWGAERRRQQRSNVCGRGQQQRQRRGQLCAAACAAGRRARQQGLTLFVRRAAGWHPPFMVTCKWWAGVQAPAASEPRGPAHELELDFRPATLAALRPSVLFRCRPATPCSAVLRHAPGAADRVAT